MNSMIWLLMACEPVPSTDGEVTDPVTCEDEIVVDGVASGFVRCPDGAINRARVVQRVPTDSRLNACGKDDGSPHDCSDASSCTDMAGGFCASDYDYTSTWCSCQYVCQHDDDCAEGFACLQTLARGEPSPATCRPVKDCHEDADCPSGECGLLHQVTSFQRIAMLTLACRTDEDSCRTHDDCNPGQNEFCGEARNGTWRCQTALDR